MIVFNVETKHQTSGFGKIGFTMFNSLRKSNEIIELRSGHGNIH